MYTYFIALGVALLTQCNAAEASLAAATLTASEKAAGYHVIAVLGDEIIEIEGFFDEVKA
ncbi:MAG: hypothetical protein ACKO0Z_13395 [Betaproteobacteria bacterium]